MMANPSAAPTFSAVGKAMTPLSIGGSAQGPISPWMMPLGLLSSMASGSQAGASPPPKSRPASSQFATVLGQPGQAMGQKSLLGQ